MDVSSWIRQQSVEAAEQELKGPGRVPRVFVLRVRVSDDERELLKLAASRKGEPFSNFMLRTARQRARAKTA
jgi:hypothetical protein